MFQQSHRHFWFYSKIYQCHISHCFDNLFFHSGSYRGLLDNYHGGGYAELLGNSLADTLSILLHLESNQWINRGYACAQG